MIAVRLARHSRDLVDSFHEHLLSLPEVLAFYHVAGVGDFLVHVGVRDSNHMRDFAITVFTERPEVARIENAPDLRIPPQLRSAGVRQDRGLITSRRCRLVRG
jgi:DNA-binding Lrp family transcriptional regulator